jgi:hypothetical protein
MDALVRVWTRLLLGSVLAWLCWRAGPGALELFTELAAKRPRALAAALRASEDERLERTLAGQDRRHGLAPGTHRELVRALERHVRPDGAVYVRPPGRKAGRMLFAMHLVVAPRTFRLLAGDPAAAGSADGSSAVLTFGDDSGARLAERLAPVARGPGWVLWR